MHVVDPKQLLLVLYMSLSHYTTIWKVASLIPKEVLEFFQFTESFESHYGYGVSSASNRNEYHQMFLGSKALLSYKADNLSAVFELII
jgi:hypothetical protein